jgi:hypothetical protein
VKRASSSLANSRPISVAVNMRPPQREDDEAELMVDRAR